MTFDRSEGSIVLINGIEVANTPIPPTILVTTVRNFRLDSSIINIKNIYCIYLKFKTLVQDIGQVQNFFKQRFQKILLVSEFENT